MSESDVEAAMQSAQGAVGSTEAPPDPWKGISGPAGPMTPHYPEHDRIAALEADNAAMVKWSAVMATQMAALTKAVAELDQQARSVMAAAFTAVQPDLPDPPRRPDGTLMPQPKALTVPRETGDKRRVGS